MLRQIRVRYDPLEDRLLLSLEVDGRMHHLLLTRRIWARARQALQKLLDLSAQAPAGLPADLRSSLSAANHQATAALTPTEREPVKTHGAPPDAVLVTGLQLGQRAPKGSGATVQRTWMLQFELQGGAGLRLGVNDKTLHALVGALLQREETAQWALPTLPARARPAAQGAHRLQ
jgi:hypothetical protein